MHSNGDLLRSKRSVHLWMRKSSNIDPWLQHWSEVSDYTHALRSTGLQGLQEKEHEENLLRSRAQEVNYKLRACEEMLHGVIEGIADDQILVRFTHIDPSDLDREFSVVIDVSSKTYKGVGAPTTAHTLQLMHPQFQQVHHFLPTLPILVDELNRTRDLYNFIKQVWEAFDELTKQQ
jgi:kinetochore protein Spc25